MPIKPRKIGGHRYSWKGWSHSSKNAQEKADELRQKGYTVRVIKNKKSKNLTQAYNLYIRRK
jgi:hypothetical protein